MLKPASCSCVLPFHDVAEGSLSAFGALCEDRDTHKSCFDQGEMRSHLMQCFENGQVFVLHSLAECCQCKNWFHQKCMNIPSAAFVEHSFVYLLTVDTLCIACKGT